MDYLEYKDFLAHASRSGSKYLGGFINGKNTAAYNHDYYIHNKSKWKNINGKAAINPYDDKKTDLEYDYEHDDRLTDEDKEKIRLHFASDPDLAKMYLEYTSARSEYNKNDLAARRRPSNNAMAENSRRKYEAKRDAYSKATKDYVENYVAGKSTATRSMPSTSSSRPKGRTRGEATASGGVSKGEVANTSGKVGNRSENSPTPKKKKVKGVYGRRR